MPILIADDDPVARTALLLMLRHNGLDVVETDGGNACLEQYMTGSFDLVISDLDMPDMHGVELARRLRAINPDLTMYAFSGSSGTRLMDDAKTVFTKVFRKPIEITSLVSEALEHCSSAAQL